MIVGPGETTVGQRDFRNKNVLNCLVEGTSKTSIKLTVALVSGTSNQIEVPQQDPWSRDYVLDLPNALQEVIRIGMVGGTIDISKEEVKVGSIAREGGGDRVGVKEVAFFG